MTTDRAEWTPADHIRHGWARRLLAADASGQPADSDSVRAERWCLVGSAEAALANRMEIGSEEYCDARGDLLWRFREALLELYPHIVAGTKNEWGHDTYRDMDTEEVLGDANDERLTRLQVETIAERGWGVFESARE